MSRLLVLLILSLVTGTCYAAQQVSIQVQRIQFIAKTNISAVKVQGEVEVSQLPVDLPWKDERGVFRIRIPILSLKTGMDLRDSHMRDKIFRSADGKYPDLVFQANVANCEKDLKAVCVENAQLSIRDQAAPVDFKIELSAESFVGSARVRLSDYKIDRPSQLGVTVQDEVELSFSGKIKR